MWFKEKWNKLMAWIGSVEGPLTFISVLFSVCLGYFSLVEWRVEKIVKDPAFIQEVARRVRPAVVFNAEGTVLADSGALDLLESVPDVRMPARDETLTLAKIKVRPKKFISEPVVESLDISDVSVAAKRAEGVSWEITIVARGEMISSGETPVMTAPPRFRLELSVK
ncbi:MAG: hypothetical protein AB9873_02290 [Syntrophobacteraceae bacterium]